MLFLLRLVTGSEAFELPEIEIEHYRLHDYLIAFRKMRSRAFVGLEAVVRLKSIRSSMAVGRAVRRAA